MDTFLEKLRATRAAVKDQEAKDAFLEKIRATRAAMEDQEAKQLQVEASRTRAENSQARQEHKANYYDRVRHLRGCRKRPRQFVNQF